MDAAFLGFHPTREEFQTGHSEAVIYLRFCGGYRHYTEHDSVVGTLTGASFPDGDAATTVTGSVPRATLDLVHRPAALRAIISNYLDVAPIPDIS